MGSIGAGHLNKEGISYDRQNVIDSILSDIKIIRNSRSDKSSYDYISNKENRISTVKRNNFISILGGRGAGKTSLLLTILDELNKNNVKSDKIGISKDFIMPIIDPDKMNLEKNSLGWIIYSFYEIVNKIVDSEENNCDFCKKDTKVSKLKNSYEDLKKCYINCREFFRNNLAPLSSGKSEYEKINQSIIISDINLERLFNDFINNYIEVIKQINFRENRNKSLTSEEESKQEEPLIIISFDDIDIKPKYGPEILNVIGNYLAHPNIIVFICGDEDTFRESLTIDMWNKYDVPEKFSIDLNIGQDKLYSNIRNRADDVLAKILPAAHKYHLNGLKLTDRLNFRPYGDFNKDSIAELLIKFKTGEGTLLEYFLTPMIDIESILKVLHSKSDEERSYNGYYIDLEDIEEYSERVTSYSDLISMLSKDKKNIDDRKDIVDMINKYKTSEYAYVLPSTSRGLINFYYKLIKLFDGGEKIKLDKIELNKGYGTSRNASKNNFIFLNKFFNIIKESNIDLIHSDEWESILNFDEFSEKVKFNFANIEFQSTFDRKQNLINVSNKLNIIKEKEVNNKKIISEEVNNKKRISESESSMIQLFYDLSKDFLGENTVNIIEDKSLYGLEVYRRKVDNVKVITNDFKTFKDYYCFKELLELSTPIIIKDLKVHRNIRDRLVVQLANIMNYIFDNNGNKYNLKFKDKNSVKKFNISTNYEKYYNDEYLYMRENDDNIFDIIAFIEEYEEKTKIFGYLINDINLNEEVSSYLGLLNIYLTSQKSMNSRFTEMEYYIEEIENKSKIIKNLSNYILEENKTKINVSVLEIFDYVVLSILIKIYENDSLNNEEVEKRLNTFINDIKTYRRRIEKNCGYKLEKESKDCLIYKLDERDIKSEILKSDINGFSEDIYMLINNLNLDLDKFIDTNDLKKFYNTGFIGVEDENEIKSNLDIYEKIFYSIRDNISKQYKIELNEYLLGIDIYEEGNWNLIDLKDELDYGNNRMIRESLIEVSRVYLDYLAEKDLNDVGYAIKSFEINNHYKHEIVLNELKEYILKKYDFCLGEGNE
ncbi:TPA: hypothetical protein ACF2DM_000881 [Clostridium perfringens]